MAGWKARLVMAKNVGERHVEDTPANRQLNAVEAVLNVALHTIKICSNESIFIPQYAKVTEMICKTAVEAYTTAYEANNILVKKSEKDYAGNVQKRLELEALTIRYLSRMLAYATIAQRLFHLRRKKKAYWSKLISEARSLVHAWNQADIERFK